MIRIMMKWWGGYNDADVDDGDNDGEDGDDDGEDGDDGDVGEQTYLSSASAHLETPAAVRLETLNYFDTNHLMIQKRDIWYTSLQNTPIVHLSCGPVEKQCQEDNIIITRGQRLFVFSILHFLYFEFCIL